jgi:hypothetical protein
MVVYELPDVITNEPEQPHSKLVPGAKLLISGVPSQNVQLIVALNEPVTSISYSPQTQGVALGVGVGLTGGGAGANVLVGVMVGVGVGVLVVVADGVGVGGTQSPTKVQSAVPLRVPLQAQI